MRTTEELLPAKDCVEIGRMLRQVRKEKHLTLDQVAQAVGVDKSTIQRYESGKTNRFSQALVYKLGKFLGVNFTISLENMVEDRIQEPQLQPVDVWTIDNDGEMYQKMLADPHHRYQQLEVIIRNDVLGKTPDWMERMRRLIQLCGYLVSDDLDILEQLMRNLRLKNEASRAIVNQEYHLDEKGKMVLDRFPYAADATNTTREQHQEMFEALRDK